MNKRIALISIVIVLISCLSSKEIIEPEIVNNKYKRTPTNKNAKYGFIWEHKKYSEIDIEIIEKETLKKLMVSNLAEINLDNVTSLFGYPSVVRIDNLSDLILNYGRIEFHFGSQNKYIKVVYIRKGLNFTYKNEDIFKLDKSEIIHLVGDNYNNITNSGYLSDNKKSIIYYREWNIYLYFNNDKLDFVKLVAGFKGIK